MTKSKAAGRARPVEYARRYRGERYEDAGLGARVHPRRIRDFRRERIRYWSSIGPARYQRRGARISSLAHWGWGTPARDMALIISSSPTSNSERCMLAATTPGVDHDRWSPESVLVGTAGSACAAMILLCIFRAKRQGRSTATTPSDAHERERVEPWARSRRQGGTGSRVIPPPIRRDSHAVIRALIT